MFGVSYSKHARFDSSRTSRVLLVSCRPLRSRCASPHARPREGEQTPVVMTDSVMRPWMMIPFSRTSGCPLRRRPLRWRHTSGVGVPPAAECTRADSDVLEAFIALKKSGDIFDTVDGYYDTQAS
eukprot:Polyplicarium_translucidae@DN3134_c0_g1_i5.p1